MKQIKGLHITLFMAGILAVLFLITAYVPDEGWKVAGHNWKFLTFEKFIHPKTQEKKDIEEIVADVDTSMTEDPLLQHMNGSNGDFGAPSGGDVSENASTELLMNDAGEANLHAFFQVLDGVAANKTKISILHYGDSQIEGDRMTGFIRQRIQNQFGGFGPGLIPATNVYSTVSFKQSFSENFQRYTAFGGASLKSGKYGVMASAARFTLEYADSVKLDTLKEVTGWIEVQNSGSAYARARQFNNVKMHYNDCKAPVKLNVYENGTLIHQEQLITDGAQHTVALSFPTTPGKLKYEFIGKVSPNICAFSLEGDYGVQVSNIGMRGSSGTVFGRLNSATATPMYKELNTKLVIMQFGGNSVPFFKDSVSVRNFAGYFKGQINRVKAMNPGAAIIVIGPSDMSKNDEGIYETYEYLPYCVSQMRKVTQDAGGAFWNLYAAMGGKNSMPSWVEKGLAGNDHIHFSNAGAKIASQKFYEAFIAAYARWKKSL
ncbi:MAG: GDSL-type esterase/lipase family protein [bacterium]|nr:GDSL-type esterase/lipase family protein [bacterium]